MIHELVEIDGLPSIAVAGYSLGGNLALKLAAEYGDHAPASLRAVAAVSPIVEIAECVDALERPGNVLYQWNFVKDLKRRMRRKERVRPGHFDLRRLDAIRTVRDFDEVYTAPYFGFRDRIGLLPSGERDAHHRARRGADARHHAPKTIRSCRRGRSGPAHVGQPVHRPPALPARRPLRIRRAGVWRG